jgi:hypothetical protein
MDNDTIKNAGQLFGGYQLNKTKIRNKRQFLLSQFLENLNEERKGKFKDLTPSFVAFKLSHLKNADLEFFLNKCLAYKKHNGSFSKYFWWALRL